MTITTSIANEARRCPPGVYPHRRLARRQESPALVVQSDLNYARLNETIIAAITSNTSRVHEAHQLLIDISTPEGRTTGLLHTSAVRCERLHTIPQTDVTRTIGTMSDALMLKIDECLKAALGIR